MLPSASRLKRRSDFSRVYGKGRSYATDLIVVYVLPARGKLTRIGFSVSKKLGKSVVRNRVKRLLREAARALLPDLEPGRDVVVVARRKAAGATLAALGSAMQELFRGSGILRAREQ